MKMRPFLSAHRLLLLPGKEVLCLVNNNHCHHHRFHTSTSRWNIDKPPLDGLTPLEFMDAHSTIQSTGTIFSDTLPVTTTADLLCGIKDLFGGSSWFSVILGTTVVVRMVTGIPTIIAQQRSLKRLEDLKPQLDQLASDLKYETGIAIKKFGWDEPTAQRQFKKSFKKHWRRLMEENNCHPMKSLCLGLMQVPIWISFSSALRNIVFGLPLPRTSDQAERWLQMFQESVPSWMSASNLTASDPYVLPLVFLSVNLLNIALHSKNRQQQNPAVVRSKLQIALPWVFGAGVVAIAWFATTVPSAVSLYWATSSSVALLQNVVFLHPTLREALKMPVYSKSTPPVAEMEVVATKRTTKSN